MKNKDSTKELEEMIKEPYKSVVSPLKGFRTKDGEIISWKEFGKRWKEGMKNLTPLQRTQNDFAATLTILIGFIVSVVALIFFNETFGAVTYGLIIIFLGSIYSNTVKLFSLKGQIDIFRNIKKQVKGGKE